MQVMVPHYLVDELLPVMQADDPEVELIPVTEEGRYQGSLEQVDALFKFYPGGRFPNVWGTDVLRDIILAAPRLKWVHSGKAGVEDFMIPELIESDIVLTNGAGFPRRAIAETVLSFILADAKALHAHYRHQMAGEWKHIPHRELQGFTVAILGLGRIGLEIARLCKALDLRVIGTRRHPPASPLPNVDVVLPSSKQDDCVAEADYVVIAAALTPETTGMVGASTLEAMKQDAILINVARGAIVDEPALIGALKANLIRGAYLDVFLEEPLPTDSPFYTLPNVIIMPHNSPFSQNVMKHMTSVFLENFHRRCHGEPLVNVVNKQAGY